MIKRLFDFSSSLAGLIVLSPLLLIIGLLIKLDSSGPVFFRQNRVGLHGKQFNIYKFRTMTAEAEELGKHITIGRDPRITRIGHFLRRSNLDELPQLINVLKGEMSIVGPRPEVPKYVELYTEEQRKVLSVKPGMTDYASIEFRNEDDMLASSSNPEEYYINELMPKKLTRNLEYINNQSLLLDIKLILETLKRIVQRK